LNNLSKKKELLKKVKIQEITGNVNLNNPPFCGDYIKTKKYIIIKPSEDVDERISFESIITEFNR